MIKDTYQLMDQLSKEMEKHRRWHPHFISPYRWHMMKMEMATDNLKKSIGEQFSQVLHGATLAMNNFAKTIAGVFK